MPKHHVVEAALTTANTVLAAEDVLASLVTFTNAVDSQLTGIIKSVTFIDFADVAGILDVMFFSAAPTVAAIGDAFAPTDGQLADFLGNVHIVAADYVGISGSSVATKYDINLPIHLSTTSLYAVVVSGDTKDYGGTTGARLHVGIQKD